MGESLVFFNAWWSLQTPAACRRTRQRPHQSITCSRTLGVVVTPLWNTAEAMTPHWGTKDCNVGPAAHSVFPEDMR